MTDALVEQSPQFHPVREFERRVLEDSSGQHEGREAAQPVRLEKHFDAFVPTEVPHEHDRPLWVRCGLVEDQVVRDEVGDDDVGAPAGKLRVGRDH